MDDLFSLKGSRALVTGASGGIGGAVARALAGAGAAVAASGRRLEALEPLVSGLPGEGHRAVPFALGGGGDEGSEAAAGLFESACEALGGPVDILVNNAGSARDGLFSRLRPDDWRAVIEVNLSAVFFLSQAALRSMARERRGRVISVSSVVASLGNAGQANYAASKAGMEGMTRCLAHEVAPRGVTVNCVAPGFIDTAMTAALPEVVRGRFLSRTPMGRAGTPEDVAAACLFLASPAAAWITGQTLHVNGGMAMR